MVHGVAEGPERAATNTARASASRDRVSWLDGIRGAAAMFVVLHHMWLETWPGFPVNTGPWWLGWLLYGHLAVAVFIVVSGFSLALAPVRNGLALTGGVRRFISRRAWRILPAYWAALVISMVVTVVVLQPDLGPVAATKGLVVHGLLVQDLIGSASPNGAFWSIAIEWQIYFVFPLILLVSRWANVATAALVTMVAVLLVHAIGTLGPPFDKVDRLTPQFLALFALGVLAVQLGRSDSAARMRAPLLVAALGALAAFVVLAATEGSRWVVGHFFAVDLLFGSAIACLLVVLYSGGGAPLRRVLASRTGLWLGLFSYSIYLVHAPIVGVLSTYVIGPLQLPAPEAFALFLFLGLPVVLGLCYGFHLLFEAPFLRRRDLGALRTSPIFGIRTWPAGARAAVVDIVRVRGRLPAWATSRRGRE